LEGRLTSLVQRPSHIHPTAWKYGFSEVRSPLDFVTYFVMLRRW
jgi:hypothetical protein